MRFISGFILHFKEYSLLYTVVLLISILSLTTSCDDDSKEIIPEDSTLIDDTTSTDEDSVIVYDTTLNLMESYFPLYDYMPYLHGLFTLQEVSSDEITVPARGLDWYDNGKWIGYHQHEFDANFQELNSTWVMFYEVIANANFAIKVLEDKSEIAEMKALRAYAYYMLMDVFGNVPIFTEETITPYPSKSSRAEIYDFVIKELLDVIEGEEYSEFSGASIANNRINIWVVKMILAKVYLNAEVYTGSGEWVKANELLLDIITNGNYYLENSYYNNFKVLNNSSGENMWVLDYSLDRDYNENGFLLGQMTLHYEMNTASGFPYNDNPWNGFCTMQEFYESYSDEDERKKSFLTGPIHSIYDKYNNVRVSSSYNYFYVDKSDWDTIKSGEEPLIILPLPDNMDLRDATRNMGVRIGKFEFNMNSRKFMENGFPIFRYADVILMAAESQLRAGLSISSEVKVELDRLRSRVGLEPLVNPSLEDIYDERGWELFIEMHRRQDMIRFGTYNNAWWQKQNSDESKNIFPIPAEQLSANPFLEQNVGY